MEENKEFEEILSSINEKFFNNNESVIEEFKDLINNQIEKSENSSDTNLTAEENEKLVIQEIFNISVKNNFIGIFKYIMKNFREKINVNAKALYNGYKQRLISIACKKGEDEIFEDLLLDDKINLDIIDIRTFDNIFIISCGIGKLDYVKLILEKAKEKGKKIDINIGNGIPLRSASLSGNIELVEYLLSLDGIDISLEDSTGNTIFMSACSNKNKDYKCVKLLYEEYKKRNIELNINKKNKKNETAICRACLFGNIDLVKYLLSLPDINDNMENFNFLYNTDCSNNNLEIVQLFYDRYHSEIKNKSEVVISDLLFVAVDKKDIETVKYFFSKPDIKNKINLNNKEYSDIFINISFNNNIEMVKVLYDGLRDKININILDYYGNTPIYNACEKGDFEMAKFLLSQKWKENIDINIAKKGRTLFTVACENGFLNIAKILYDRPDFDKEKNKFIEENKKTNWVKYFEKNVDIIDESKGLVKNQTRIFREYKNLENKNIIIDTVYNINDINKNKPLYQIKYGYINKYTTIITFFIKEKTFTATVDRNQNIIFNFDGFNNEINSDDFEKEINNILNNFKNVDSFDTYTSWLPLALIDFKKYEKERIQKKAINNEIEFFSTYNSSNKIKEIANNNSKNKNKIFIFDFSFSPKELETIGNSSHAIPLVIFNSKDSDNNTRTKILAFNTGFKSEKAFEKFQKELGNEVEIIKIDKDLSQKYGSCNISPKPMIEALFSLFMNELEEGESLIDKLEQYSKDMIIANRLAKIRDENSIINKVKNTLFSAVSTLNELIGIKNNTNESHDINNTNLDNEEIINSNNVEEVLDKEKIETKEEILKDINLEEYLERLKKYKEINEKLAENYEKLYINSKNLLNSVLPLNKNLDKVIEDINETIEKKEMEKNFKDNPLDYIY